MDVLEIFDGGEFWIITTPKRMFLLFFPATKNVGRN